MADESLGNKEKVNAETHTFRRRVKEGIVQLAPGFFLTLISAGIVAIVFLIYSINYEKINESIKQTPSSEIALYIVSWLILFVISYLASIQIKEIILLSSSDKPRQYANYISIMIGLVITVILFKQSFLLELFGTQTLESWLKAILLGGGGGIGWIVWYLKQIERYGEFFNILLQALVVGFCWYARLTAPEGVQVVAVGFLLGSLFRVAKDYLDKSALQSPTPTRNETQ